MTDMTRTTGVQPISADRQTFWQRIEYACAVCAVFLSAVNFLRTNMFYFTLSDLLFCVALGLRALTGGLPLRLWGRASATVWLCGLLLLCSGLMISSLLSTAPTRGIVIVGQYLFAYLVIALAVCGRDLRTMWTFAKVYVLSIFLMCLHGIYLIDIDGQKNTAFVSGNGRLTGFVERENECAAVIALAMPILLLLVSRGKVGKVYATVVGATMAYGILLTGSNTGLASFAFALLGFLVLSGSWKYVVVGLACLTPFALWIVHSGRDYLPVVFQRRVLGALETGDLSHAGSFDHRLQLIHEALGRVQDNMWIGLGADQYQVTSAVEQPVHNLYLLLATEGGIIAAIGFGVMIAATFQPIMRTFRVPGGAAYAACAFVSVSMFALMANAFPHLYGRFWTVPVILTLGLATSYCGAVGNRSIGNGALPPVQISRAGRPSRSGLSPIR
ncbi:O-antigen ligase family protein [Ensifer sp. ENS11]|uniref:O-antigen ligase family protein n=1 Tax=Ensifer sp. ENS11 TaxID=2769291 RepID=UPI0017847E7A|nr:O-antigen ligase family protein [Ensifer sp. ENS11]MBD9490043.1 O-antigen ligase family protein [Ensifer sp. ENS11]